MSLSIIFLLLIFLDLWNEMSWSNTNSFLIVGNKMTPESAPSLIISWYKYKEWGYHTKFKNLTHVVPLYFEWSDYSNQTPSKMTEESSAKLIQQPHPPTAWSRNEFHLTMIPLKMRSIAKGFFILLSMHVD
jgi:hypothetical protein